jgi:hypothetical protein
MGQTKKYFKKPQKNVKQCERHWQLQLSLSTKAAEIHSLKVLDLSSNFVKPDSFPIAVEIELLPFAVSVIVSSSAIPKGERRILLSSLSPLAIEVIKVPKKLSPDRHSKKN